MDEKGIGKYLTDLIDTDAYREFNRNMKRKHIESCRTLWRTSPTGPKAGILIAIQKSCNGVMYIGMAMVQTN